MSIAAGALSVHDALIFCATRDPRRYLLLFEREPMGMTRISRIQITKGRTTEDASPMRTELAGLCPCSTKLQCYPFNPVSVIQGYKGPA